MKKILLVAAMFILPNLAYASWSAYAHVTPESENNYDLTVSLTPVKGDAGNIIIKFDAVGYDHKSAWLIVASGSLSSEEQNLRNYIWGSAKPVKEILIKTRLMPYGVGHFNGKTKEKYYEIELNEKIMERAYIYIDFPGMVFDGGYFYSIDLGEYFKKGDNYPDTGGKL